MEYRQTIKYGGLWFDNILIRYQDAQLQSPEKRIETRVLVKSHEGRNVSVERKVWKCVQWKTTGQCSNGDSCSFNHGSYPCRRAQSSISTSRTPTLTMGRKPLNETYLSRRSLSGLKGKRTCQAFFWKGKCTEPSCDLWHPPECLNLQVWIRMQVWWPLSFQTHWGWWPAQWEAKEKRRNWVVWPKIALRRSLFCGKLENWDRITHSSSPRPRCVTHKFGKERVHRRESCKNVHFRSEFRGLQNSRKERKTKPWKRSDAPAEIHGTLQRMSVNSKSTESVAPVTRKFS